MNKVSAAKLSIMSNITLIIAKVIVGVITNSISIISEAVHSCLDLVAAIMAYFAVRGAQKPPDEGHQFGHGKFENVSGLFEGLLIFAAAGIIIYEAIEKIINKPSIEHLGAGLGVMAFSAVVNIIVSRKLMKVAKKTDSIALSADAAHLATDVYSCAGVFGGLAVVSITGKQIFDPITAIVVAIFILQLAFTTSTKAIEGLVDLSLPEDDKNKIMTALGKYDREFVDFHDLRTRKSGSQRHIDTHLTVSKFRSLGDVHNLCDTIEADINSIFKDVVMLIHPEPCNAVCGKCRINNYCPDAKNSPNSFS